MTWNADGNTTSDGVTTFTWEYGNRMSGASRPGMMATYAYDAEDRRTRKTVNGVVTRMLWSGSDELGQYSDAGSVIRRFVPDGTGGMDARLATVANTGDVYWHHTDRQGSVIATSDSNGQTVGVATYSPHGEFGDGQSAPPQHSPFGYTGREFDPETGLYQYRARYYSPRLGQFPSMDPIGSQDDPNLYMYVGLDPVNATDPSGKCKNDPLCDGRFDGSTRVATPGGLYNHYRTGKGELYVADPQRAGVDDAIDIGSQIQTSVTDGGYYAGYAADAVACQCAVNVPGRDAPHGFNQEPGAFAFRDSARGHGRFQGSVMQGVMRPDPNNEFGYRFQGTLELSDNDFNFRPDDDPITSAVGMAVGAATGSGHSFPIEFNRTYSFTAHGQIPEWMRH